MASHAIRNDKHFPTFAFDNFLRKLLGKPNRYADYVKQGQAVADLGCGPGFFTFPLADSVRMNGRVYAVDSDENAIHAVERKARKKMYDNVDAHVSSAARLDFIEDETVDFVLADGLICCVAPQEHPETVSEIKRIMKPGGKALLITSTSSISYVDDLEWESILTDFNVEERNYPPYKGERRAIVSKR
jgi:ubiquinone/menaquinone biosynthesis C-methylase UbiE